MPIAQEVHNALFEGKSVQRCLIDLLSREQKDELAGRRGVGRAQPLAASRLIIGRVQPSPQRT